MISDSSIQPLMNRAARLFTQHFGHNPQHAAAAPARVNLIGEHTDYNDGFVLPMAINRHTLIVAAVNHSPRCRIVAADIDDEMTTFRLDNIAPGKTQWANYIKGVFAQFQINGQQLPGIDAVICSDIPIGAGLSSSAALEMALATLLEHLLQIQVDPRRKALWCQKAEHEFAAVPCGIMDQFIAAMAQSGRALLIDCRTHDIRPVLLDDPGLTIVIADTNVRHEHAAGEYATRRNQCEQAAAALNVPSLRDATLQQLDDMHSQIDPVIYRRARHVIAENQRTLLAAAALDARDYQQMGALMLESHRSLRDDFQASCPQLDTLVDLAMQFPRVPQLPPTTSPPTAPQPSTPRDAGTHPVYSAADNGVYGSRMTGGGFGGCTVTLAATHIVQPLINHLQTAYSARYGVQPTCFATTPSDAAKASTLPQHA